jgi:hypothetical protein
MLPASFGSIQLGETFSSCLSVNNETPVSIEVAKVRVEMQTATSKMVLYEMDGLETNLPGGDALEHIVHHEIKELGQHVLACAVTYRLPQNARAIAGASEDVNDPSLQTFRKFYKFAVCPDLSKKSCSGMFNKVFRLGYQPILCENKGSFCQITICTIFSNGKGEDFPRGSHTKPHTRRYIFRENALGMH